MFNCLKKAHEIAKILYRGHPHPDVANVHYYLGRCEEERGRFAEAVNHYHEYLKIDDEQRIECQQNDHDCITAEVLLRIASLGKECSYDTSYLLSCSEKALEIEENVHGKESCHDHLAKCFELVGTFMITENHESKGLEYLGKHFPNEVEKHLTSAKAALKKTLSDHSHVALLQINFSLLEIFQQTNRIQDGLELANEQRHLIDTMLSKSNSPRLEDLTEVFNLAGFYEANGRRCTAKEMYIDLITRLEEIVDLTDPEKDDLMQLLWISEQRVGTIYQTDGKFSDAEAMFERLVSSVEKTTSQRSFVKVTHNIALCNLASIFTETRRYLQAYKIMDDLINIYENDPEVIDFKTASCVFFVRGELNRRCFRHNDALLDLEKALKMAEHFRGATLHDVMFREKIEIHRARIMNCFGLIHEEKNNLKRALECYLCCLSTVEGMQPSMDTATFHHNVADTLKKLGQLDDALVHYKKSLEIRDMLHSEDPVREDIATVLYHIAIVQYTDEKPKDASKTLDKLIPLRKELLKKGSYLQNYGAAVVLKGNCHFVQQGETEQAKDAYEEAEKVYKIMTGGQPNLDYAGVISNIGQTCLKLRQWEQAISKLQKALELKRIIYEDKAAPEVALACHLLATAFLQHQEYEKALPYFQEALGIYEISLSSDDETDCVLNIALCYKGMENLDSALESFRKLEKLCVKKSISDGMRLDIHKIMAETFMEEEYADRSKVLHHFKEAEAILKQIKRPEMHEEDLNELQAKMLSLEIA